ncbi:hypothetical protein [Acinetobacter sp. SFB]|uniref:hypothetical protein n=1 Tax=Acinetobacter sp. SFB TaxID=1805634 RepID=UPI001BB40791|nr:hypothetical protein [Acinetobacter sp. SFB]
MTLKLPRENNVPLLTCCLVKLVPESNLNPSEVQIPVWVSFVSLSMQPSVVTLCVFATG